MFQNKKCSFCSRYLTDGEMRTHFFKPRFLKSMPTCWHCSQKIIKQKKLEIEKKYDKKN